MSSAVIICTASTSRRRSSSSTSSRVGTREAVGCSASGALLLLLPTGCLDGAGAGGFPVFFGGIRLGWRCFCLNKELWLVVCLKIENLVVLTLVLRYLFLGQQQAEKRKPWKL